MTRKTISRELARQAGRALSAARARKALTSDERVAHWAGEVLTASSDAAAQEIISTINALQGLDGPGPGDDEAGAEALEALLWPPPPGEEERWEQLAASARAEIDADVADAEADAEADIAGLWPPSSPEEADRRIMASRRAPRRRARRNDDWSDEELHAAVFADTTWTGPGGAPWSPPGGDPGPRR